MSRESDRQKVQRELGSDSFLVRYSARDLVWPLTTSFGPVIYGAVTSGRVAFAAGLGFFAYVFGQLWRVVRRRIAFAVGPAGIYLGRQSKIPAEVIPWADISAVEISLKPRAFGDGRPHALIISLRREDESDREKVADGWILDPGRLTQAVLQFGGMTVGLRELPAAIHIRALRRIRGLTP
ncbi:hypothetical protein [Planotetraspora kaengkrachanensis]|uniref:PH domain-containing protein n=1 Tax=Planotetraspora kaengkrachanensis TaxID=575193 RepID=A0A8J3V7U1_9ACTN|nr:hypothetical protein [Planotetraspora kaengkrachanensis]GIG81568.1 hypothetical protein Pka01_46950 [Planotetraspora kaengkrachanensis]